MVQVSEHNKCLTHRGEKVNLNKAHIGIIITGDCRIREVYSPRSCRDESRFTEGEPEHAVHPEQVPELETLAVPVCLWSSIQFSVVLLSRIVAINPEISQCSGNRACMAEGFPAQFKFSLLEGQRYLVVCHEI